MRSCSQAHAYLLTLPRLPFPLSQYGADLVQMVTIDTQYCGVGYTPVVGTNSFGRDAGLSVVTTQCMTTTSAHEIGHNFGCNHDYTNIENGVTIKRTDKYNGLAR